ncbi:MAG TPA: carboxylating nicotinate-nucleotide diphosphorylase [Candidatus Bathyarchaeia archaeon]|nr:carboxylating nicotinate-nucleotide diphosphorylase [Candidatus Bathyarchaeia archaeon]
MNARDIERFLAEDQGFGDITTALLPDVEGSARIVAHEDGIVAGLSEAQSIFAHCNLVTSPLCCDGDAIKKDDIILRIVGPVRDILVTERVALNTLCRMSGIATVTRRCADAAGAVTVAATRKTTPGFRFYEKKAVEIGGGDPHRYSLSDAYLFKDNHLKVISAEQALRQKKFFTKKVEIEVESVDACIKAAELGADIIMFDNMNADQITAAVQKLKALNLRDRVLLEASGGIKPESVKKYAATGVDMLSLGYLTHSSRWLDLSLELEAPD